MSILSVGGFDGLLISLLDEVNQRTHVSVLVVAAAMNLTPNTR